MQINNEDIKVLKFKDELVNLLNKYNYDIEGNNIDNGSIIIDTHDNFYELTSDKNILKETYNENSGCHEDKNIMQELIKCHFKGNIEKIFCIGNHGNHKCGIITNDEEKALKILNKIKNDNKDIVESFYSSPINIELKLKNGDDYLWVNPTMYARGYRFHELYIDKNITYEFFEYVLPIIGQYCAEENIHII